MRALGTELNMLKRLGFKPNSRNLSGSTDGHIAAFDALDTQNLAHVIYAATYRGKNCRNKTPLHVDLQPSDLEFFMDDKSFFKRTNVLYSKGVYWIGACHRH